MKDKVSKDLDAMNRFGAGADANLFFVFHPDTMKQNLSVFTGIRTRNHTDSRFSKDLYEIYFRGNKNYADKTADFSDFELNSYQYKQFSVGLANDYRLHSGKIFIGAGINITGGKQFTKIMSPHSTLYTQQEGEYLDGNFDVTYQRDDSATAGFIPTEGQGISLDFFAEYETHSGDKFTASVENLGNIYWNRFSTTVRIDSVFRFEGIDVSNLFSFNDSLRSSVSVDSTYKNFLTNRKEERITTHLPVYFSAAYTHPFLLSQFNLTVGISYMAYANSNLNYFIIGNFKINSQNEISPILSYGGYDAFNIGVKYEHQFTHGFSVEVGSNYLSSMIAYNQGHSQGAFVSLAKKFQ
jgi:hypothetical protein